MFQSDGLHPNTEGLIQNHQEWKIRAKVSGFESQVNKNCIHHLVFLGLMKKLMHRTPCSKPHCASQQTSTTGTRLHCFILALAVLVGDQASCLHLTFHLFISITTTAPHNFTFENGLLTCMAVIVTNQTNECN